MFSVLLILQAGDYVVTIMDHFGADFSVLFVAACECFAVMWVYGKVTSLEHKAMVP
jgi:hypothetical protein